MQKTKPFQIEKRQVFEAWKKVRSKKGCSGIDGESIADFESNLSGNLYKLWNRMSSGSYFPPAVREVQIPKGNGKMRSLGIPTVSDRVAQQVVKDVLEPLLEPMFDTRSYGYRPLKSAHQALHEVYANTKRHSWVVDLDIQSFFDHVDHEKMEQALDLHIEEKWVRLYIRRWLKAKVLRLDKSLEARAMGTPQGGVISPLLANLYLHYTFDKWMVKKHGKHPFVRYADDIIVHTNSREECEQLLSSIKSRMKDCGLTIHPEKSKIVHCRNYRRGKKEEDIPNSFDFLGFSFRPQLQRDRKKGGTYLWFSTVVSIKSRKRIGEKLRKLRFHRNTGLDLLGLAKELNPLIQGWMNYYEKFRKYSLNNIFHHLHNKICKWLLNKYKGLKGSIRKGFAYLREIRRRYPKLFYHWSQGYSLV